MPELHTEDRLSYAQDALVTLSAAQLAAPTTAQRAGLPHCRAAFARNGGGRVGFYGGSITRMTGWSDLTQTLLREHFPGVALTCINGAIGGTNSTYGAFRCAADLLAQGPLDLLFLEFAVNDGGPVTPDNQRLQGLEGIVRQVRQANPATDILYLCLADEGKVQAYRQQHEPAVITHHQRIAAHYGLPTLNLALAVTRQLDAGAYAWPAFSGDSCHPTPFGHTQYRDAIRHFLAAEWADTATPAAAPLPPPLCPDHLEHARLIGTAGARLQSGWTLVPGWLATQVCNYAGPVDVLTSTTPGATLELDFCGTTVAIDALSGMDAGVLEVSIDGGPASAVQLFDNFSAKFHRPVFRVLAHGLPRGAHQLTLRLAATHHPDSLGTAARIRQFAVA